MCKGKDDGGGGGSCNCALRNVAITFACWTIFLGAVGILCWGYFITLKYKYEDRRSYVLSIVLLALSILHLISGLILVYGIVKKIAHIFLIGIILSSIYPYLLVGIIIPAALQVLFTICGCRYLKKDLNSESQK